MPPAAAEGAEFAFLARTVGHEVCHDVDSAGHLWNTLLEGNNGAAGLFSEPLVKQLCTAVAEDLSISPESCLAAAYFSWLRARLSAHEIDISNTEESGLRLALGAASLLCFVRANISGPTDPPPTPVVELFVPRHGKGNGDVEAAQQPAGPQGGFGVDTMSADDRWATGQLRVDGEDLLGRCRAVQYLLLARVLLLEPLYLPQEELQAPAESVLDLEGKEPRPLLDQERLAKLAAAHPTWLCWAARTAAMHQHVLDGRSATLLATLQGLQGPVLAWAATLGADAGEVGRQLQGALHVEAAMAMQSFGYVEAARKLLAAAGDVLGLEVAVTGAMGMRTVHQVEAKAQLVVQAAGSRQQPAEEDGQPLAELCLEGKHNNKELEGVEDTSDVYTAPRLVNKAGQLLEARYRGTEQALLLAWASQVKIGTTADELQAWEMAPYVEAVLSQPRSHFMLQVAARLLKARHEGTRGRTRERALMQLESLVEAVRLPGLAPSGRIGFAFAAPFPSISGLRKELAEACVAMGFVGAALKIYEEEEMWEQLIACYRLLEKRTAAEELVMRRLQVTPDDPKLWCVLGDLHLDDKHYETAWERSGRRYTRAQRALGRTALRRKEYSKSAQHYETALAINPLHPEAWFALGYCYLKTEQQDPALRAFTKCAQQEADNGEAWNNIAVLWLQKDRPREAFWALSEAVKYKRDDWRTWENYAYAAMHTGALQKCLRGLQQVMTLSGGTRLRMDVVSGLMSGIEEMAQEAAEKAAAVAAADTTTPAEQGASGAVPGPSGASPVETTDGAADATTTAAAGPPGVVPGPASAPPAGPMTPEAVTGASQATAAVPAAQEGGPSTPSASQQPTEGSAVPGAMSGAYTTHPDASAPASHAAASSQPSPPHSVPATVTAGAPPLHANGSSHTNALHDVRTSPPANGDDMAPDSAMLDLSDEEAVEQPSSTRQQLSEPGRKALEASFHALLKAAANSSVACAELWGVLARFHRLQGDLETAKESLLKQVRGLMQSSGWKSDTAKFLQVASASQQLCSTYVSLFREGSGSGRQELAAARMHLRSVLAQCKESFGDGGEGEAGEAYRRLEALLKEIVELEAGVPPL